jgi:hypothetical protein
MIFTFLLAKKIKLNMVEKKAKRHGNGVIQRKKGGQEQDIRQNLNQGQIYGGPIKQCIVYMIA